MTQPPSPTPEAAPRLDTGVSPDGAGLLPSVEPVPVSPLRAAIPDAAHTPGPWHIDEEWKSDKRYPHWRAINSEFDESYQRMTVSGHIGEANARLIAAAPEMLVALIELEGRFGHVHCFPIDMARAVIAKATAQAIEAGTAETRSGSVHESAVGNADASELDRSPPLGEGEWRDIASAPKDGAEFIATGWDFGRVGTKRHTVIAYWSDEDGFVERGDYEGGLHYLDHWMPLPTPPSTHSGESGE